MGEPAVIPAYRMDLVATSCSNCGIEFAVPRGWDEERRKKPLNFFCPNGHSLVYRGETPEQKRIAELERQVAKEKREREWAESQRRSADIRRGKAEKALQRQSKRVACGVCPHCHRTFRQLVEHMKTKHPELALIKVTGA